MEFVGTYYHALDDKGRVAVPKKFRLGLEVGSVVTKGLDGCLFIFPAEYWRDVSTKLKTLPLGQKNARDFLRLMTYSAALIDFDSLGRTRFPEVLAATANIKKDVVFVGTLTRIEVWDKKTYHDYFDNLVKNENKIVTSLGELGI